MYSTNTDTSVLDVETADSVTRYQGGGTALPDDYFKGKQYSHLIKERYNVLTYTWAYNDLNGSSTIKQYADLSDKIVSVSYTCDSSSNIKTSASLTLYVPPNDSFWYSNQEYNIGSGSTSGGGHSNGLIMWEPQIYHISQIFEDETVSQTSADYRYIRDLGFFFPNSTSYTYDNTTSQLTLQLVNLSYMMTAEGGGTIVTAMRSYDYYFTDDYNNNPRTILSYYTQENIENGEEPYRTSIKQMPKTEEQHDQEYTSLKKEITNVMENVSGVIFGTAPYIAYSDGSPSTKTIHTPLPLSISGEDGFGSYKMFSGGDIARIIYSIVRCDNDVIMNDFYIPLTGFITPHQDAENIAKTDIFPKGWDFDNGANMMDIAKTILKDRYYEPMIWIDENRKLCIDTVPPYKNKSRQVLYYSYYGELVISEDISVSDNNFYDVVEVYGKNGEYYGIADASFNGFKTGFDIGTVSSYVSAKAVQPKVKTITDESLESNEDCKNLASYEVWKSTRGNTTITVKLRDNCIKGFVTVSHVVGCAFVEYKTLQGNGKSILCILRKASLSDGIWTWELEPFETFAPSYYWYANNFYWRWKTATYDVFLGAKWGRVDITEELASENTGNGD